MGRLTQRIQHRQEKLICVNAKAFYDFYFLEYADFLFSRAAISGIL
jgi:hypothetical protein